MLALGLAFAITGVPGLANEEGPDALVKVITRREGDVTRFFVQNLTPSEVTATFEVHTVNLESTKDFPCTATYPPFQVMEAFSLSPNTPDAKWHYAYTNYFTLGSCDAVHDDAWIYSLPYAPGRSYRVTQGYNGSYSHTGPERFAIDWKMPVGTPVYAARSGVVVKVKDDSDRGGPNRKYDRCANYVLIRHRDGTIGNYAHLSKNGARVKVGQEVSAGALIALSGNTGFSSGPHLHFSVFRTRNGKERESVPIRFRTHRGEGTILLAGRSYEAVHDTAALADTALRRTPSPGTRISERPPDIADIGGHSP